MLRGLARLFGCFLLLSLTATEAADDVRFVRISRGIIENRLAEAPSGLKNRRKWLEETFRSLGCDGARLETQKVPRSTQPNVICTLEGSADSVIVVGGHYDYSNRGSGVADNWSGASLLPSLYESLKQAPRRYTFVFVAFAGEETGLHGSRTYVKKLGREGRAKIAAMINLDTLGLGPANVWVSKSDKKLMTMLARVAAALKLPLGAVNADQVGSGDFVSFRSKRIPCLVLHSITQRTFPILHSPRDNLKAIQFDDYYRTYVLLSAYLAYLDIALE